MVAIAPLREPFAGVERIAVLRGGGLGDLLFALPAVEALAAAYPEAEITLLGTPAHRVLLAGVESPVAHVEILPVAQGVRDGEGEDSQVIEDFTERMRARRFDLAAQLHGGGRYSNPFLRRLGARHTIGSRTPDAVELERTIPYVYYQHEMLRGLEIVGLAGAPATRLEPLLHVDPERRDRLAAALPAGGPLVLIHPGATDRRRRWPSASFAEVARALLADGARVLVVGDASDVPAAEEIVDAAPGTLSWAGAVELPDLAPLLSLADLVLGNDSGPRHLAAAVGAPTVGIFWVGNAINAAPLGRQRHRVQLSWTTRCPVCGRDATQVGWTAPRCEHETTFVADVRVEAVLEDVRAVLAATR
ncbi:glycosyltransferase family 9 protein [Rathayibacter iranicus]|uniref:Glycosyltransferase family 9 protein n=2 Tax=Rathayibacter iranicus TaxID=59737 RepID=A0AAD1AEE7_9MICO|nr:glycosyltransferase family 9 protein [Rathayibacter iranicus]AZZ54686.1 glycosyltransferase family 9 protein [Rathayibacter iranicus]MWV30471.1 glycosyltransferase family 9 protein [Rathayibacter iranicus NCPPB 2253 = VKM Ac-1602]PPI51049.1 glycosyltransferase family 9 protein [Rathayibacter iranicus]PPI63465.1 glycosyltransferase family 9 protein [Rathayibacter iranicus]PPI74175.1 glycosyltransferase family 9 protein [Rathayibacter iranicus]